MGGNTDSFYIFLWFDDIIDGPLGNFIYGFNDGDWGNEKTCLFWRAGPDKQMDYLPQGVANLGSAQGPETLCTLNLGANAGLVQN